MAPHLVNPQFFTHNPLRNVYTCNICSQPQRAVPLSLAVRHEDTQAHTHAVRMRDHVEEFVHRGDVVPQDNHSASVAEPAWDESGAPIGAEAAGRRPGIDPSSALAADDPWLHSYPPYSNPTSAQTASNTTQPSKPVIGDGSSPLHGPALPDDAPGQIYDNWHGMLQYNRPDIDGDSDLLTDSMGDGVGPTLAEELAVRMGEPGEDEAGELETEGPQFGLQGLSGEAVRDAIDDGPHYMKVHLGDQDYWPWNDRPHCTLDVLGGFPRSMYSESELEATRWFGHANGMARLPSVKAVKRRRDQIVDVAGSKPQMFKSSGKNMYTMTSLKTILLHEYANPLVMAHLQTIPEDSSDELSEAAQADRWAEEVDPSLACPMARTPDGKSFFVNEFAMVVVGTHGGLAPVMIRRWFRFKGALWAKVNPVLLGEDRTELVIDARNDKLMAVPLLSFRSTVEDLLSSDASRTRLGVVNMPSPTRVAGVLVDDEAPLEPWHEPVRNPWRIKAQGMRVDGCPLWLYCDDTSGNTSKKWNKHNSLLITLAGLPRRLVHLMYNIHYLATSNLAPPLEMMEELVEQLCEARRNGIVVWDCIAKESVLVIPWILAFLGDNPMSSEFASHIGMQGKCFCRKCKVKGADAKNRPAGDAGERERLQDFLSSVHPDRTKADTVRDLEAQLTRVLGGAPSAVDDMATESGTKDKFFMAYVAQLQETINEVREKQKTNAPPRGMSKKEEIKLTLQKIREAMPKNLFNPVLQIPELDPNQDTPFEALHVVLLGAVKYFWRDAVSRQSASSKEVLITRLNSLDTRGLGMSLLRGETLVHYAGSLVGRDFRAVLQVAPAVLYDLIPPEAYEAWLALGRLAPLIFQPVIHDRSSYQQRLTHAVEDFLSATALWSTQWFNKPKFHLFLHLPFYVRRFGPALLYATEGFESYNFLIRLRSVHSNRHAPSADIAQAFSFLHAVRHLVSGGYVDAKDDRTRAEARRQAGNGVRDLVKDPIFRHLMGMDGMLNVEDVVRLPLLPKDPRTDFGATLAAQRGFSAVASLLSESTVLRCVGLYLENGDVAREGGWVMYRESDVDVDVRCGRVEEILLRAEDGGPLGLLLRKSTVSRTSEKPYRLPAVRLDDGHVFIAAGNVLGTVHVFHNCAKHECRIAQTKSKTQERVVMDEKANEMLHTNPSDLVLNLAQLSNAPLLTPFRLQLTERYPNLSHSMLIDRAVDNRTQLLAAAVQKKNEQDEQKAQRAVAKAAKAAEKRTRDALQFTGGPPEGVAGQSEDAPVVPTSSGSSTTGVSDTRGRGEGPSKRQRCR